MNNWEQNLDAFAQTVEDFNVRGQRMQIPHPGFCIVCKFCPECGESLETLEIKKLDWRD